MIPDLLTRARKQNFFAIDATAGGYWTSTTNYKVTVPVNKRYYLFGGAVYRSVSATLTVRVFNSANQLLYALASHAATTGITSYPNQTADGATYSGAMPIPLDTGDYVSVVFGIAQDASAYASCIVLEVSV